MDLASAYEPNEPTRADVDARPGPLLLEFGSPTCGHCRRAEPLIEKAKAAVPGVAHVKVADGSGQPLGRSFGVRRWPTLVFLRDGVERTRLVRPLSAAEIEGTERRRGRARLTTARWVPHIREAASPSAATSCWRRTASSGWP